jgi:hypothetical protein
MLMTALGVMIWASGLHGVLALRHVGLDINCGSDQLVHHAEAVHFARTKRKRSNAILDHASPSIVKSLLGQPGLNNAHSHVVVA